MDATDPVTVIFSTAPDQETAERIAARLVEYRLAACVNLIPGIRSVYRWEGRVQNDAEVLLMIKARAADYEQIEMTIRAQHSYELPEIIAVSVTDGLPGYLDWVRKTPNEAP